jgi:hypothetical protein
MKGFLRAWAFILCLLLVLVSAAPAQELTGSLRGTVTDNEGNPLPGVTITASSPVLMGVLTSVTTDRGIFRFPSLPPGTYTVKAELPGFKTLERTGVVVRVGMTVAIDISLEPAAIAEEITVTAATPVVDTVSAKIAVVMDRELLKNIPMARDLYDIVNSAPGAISEGQTYRRTSSIHGATVRSNTYSFDGVNMNDPVVMYPLTNINFDVMDEVEMITAGQPASVGYTDGAYINIVTKSGGNRFSGGLVLYYTAKGLNQQLWSDDQYTAMGVRRAAVDKSNVDGSFTLGGPIIKDRLWFFTNGRYIRREQITNFIGPWTDILGYVHNPYNWTHKEMMGFAKLTGQISSKIKLMFQFNYVDIYRPMYEEPGSRTTFEATRIWDHEKGITLNSQLNYILNKDTFLDFRAGYVHRDFPLPLQPARANLPWVDDVGDLYGALTIARFNEYYLRKRFQTGLYFTRFQDNFLSGSHEIKGGVEFEDAYGDWDWYRANNMNWYLNSKNPWPYYYTSAYGRVDFYICGTEKGSTKIIDRARRIGAYLQDSATFFERLTLNVGVRYDRSWGWKPAVTKTRGADLSYWVGENVVRPYVQAQFPEEFPEGLNPFGDATSPYWPDIITWNSWSPRAGFTFDLFGNGKTALKFSYAGYTEYLMLQYFSTLHSFYPTSYRFDWLDENGDGYPNIGDWFGIYSSPDFRPMDPEFSKKKLDPGVKSPINNEFTAGIQHELFKNLSVTVDFIYKKKTNLVEDALYSPDLDKYWYHMDQEIAKTYWLPYKVIIPGTDNYPDREVTFYVRRKDSPPLFTRLNNVPELYRKYVAGELIVNKRMSNRWQFNGSVVLSKATGNIGGFYDQSWGWSGAADSPNTFVNAEGRINIDRPLQIKLMGTAVLPYRFLLSAYYQYFSGAPWTRMVNIRPASDWCNDNNAERVYYSVNIEPEGSRRLRPWNQLDLRLEKEFNVTTWGRIGVYADLLNVLGFTGVNVGLNDIYRWDSSAEGTNQGVKTPDPSYKVISSAYGIRTIRFTVRFSFF